MNQHVLKRATIVGLATAAALGGLTACNPTGGSSSSSSSGSSSSAPQPKKKTIADLTGPEIANKAVKATQAATSLTMDFDGVIDGEDMTFHMTMDTKGECAGSLKSTDGTIKLIKTGDTVYMKFDDAYWKAQGKDGDAAKALIGGRWMTTKATSADAKDLASACDLSQVLTGFDDGDTVTVAKKGATTTVNGTPAITLTDRDGAEHFTVYVATQGEPYIVKLVVKGGKEPGSALFSHFNEPVKAKAPAAKDTVDLDKLGG